MNLVLFNHCKYRSLCKRILSLIDPTSLATGSGVSYAYLEFRHSDLINLLKNKNNNRLVVHGIHDHSVL